MPDAIKRVGKWVGKRLRRKGKGEEETASQDPETLEESEEEETAAAQIIVAEQEGDTAISPRHKDSYDGVTGSKEPVASLTADPKKGNEAVEKALKHALSKQGLNSNIPPTDVDAIPFDWKELAKREASECQRIKQVKMQEIDKNDIIILIMGPTGVGKSSFVQAAERAFRGSITEDRHTIGHSLDSGTQNVECLSIEIPNTTSKLILVDTPGFDDRERPDSEILSIIGKWLRDTYSQQKQINGIVYLHRIQDVRFDAGVATTLSIFQKLCGGGPVYGRVVFTTSGWNNVQERDWAKHEEREKELKDGPWKPMLIRTTDAATTSRFDATNEETEKDTVMRTLWTLVKSVNKTVLLLQKELVDQKLSLPRTTAGKAVFTTEEKIRYQLVQLAGLLQPSSD